MTDEDVATRGLPRLLFHRLADRTGTMLGAASTPSQIRADLHATSANVGNLIHLEATARLLRHNRRAAARVRAEGPEAAATIERQFDGIVLGYSNIIRPHEGLDEAQREDAFGAFVRDTAWLAETRLPIYAMGIGLQEPLDTRPEAVDPRLFALLKLLNDKAVLFAVRGEETAGWLHAVGLTNALALGCPSLFLYPRNVLATRPIAARAPRIATAGRLQLNREQYRIEAIERIGAAIDASYVFQNDFWTLLRDDAGRAVYNDATGEVDGDLARRRAREHLGFAPSFTDYRLFRSTDQWRGFASGKDGYFGDRFHGGVVFLQCGKPAVIVKNDLRVAELAAFYDLPTATSVEIMDGDPRELLHERAGATTLARFHEAYRARYRDFHAALRGVGLELFNDISPEDL